VSLWGENDLQLQVQVDPQKLRAKGVTRDQVIATTGNGVFVSPLTYLQGLHAGQRRLRRHHNQRSVSKHLLARPGPGRRWQVRRPGRKGVRLEDIGTVVEDHQPLIGSASVHGSPGLVMVIEKLPGADTMAVTNAVNTALDAMAPGLTDIAMRPLALQAATFVKTAEHNLTRTGSIAAIALLLAIAVLMVDWRRILVCVLACRCRWCAPPWVLHLRGETFDSMSFHRPLGGRRTGRARRRGDQRGRRACAAPNGARERRSKPWPRRWATSAARSSSPT